LYLFICQLFLYLSPKNEIIYTKKDIVKKSSSIELTIIGGIMWVYSTMKALIRPLFLYFFYIFLYNKTIEGNNLSRKLKTVFRLLENIIEGNLFVIIGDNDLNLFNQYD